MSAKKTKLRPVAVIASLLALAPIASWAFDRHDNEAIDAIDHIYFCDDVISHNRQYANRRLLRASGRKADRRQQAQGKNGEPVFNHD